MSFCGDVNFFLFWCFQFRLLIVPLSLQGELPKSKSKKSTGVNRAAHAANVSEVRDLVQSKDKSTLKSSDSNKRKATPAGSNNGSKKPCISTPSLSSSLRGRQCKGVTPIVESSESDNEVEINGKKVKIDLDFSPRKCEAHQNDLKQKQQTIVKLQGVNDRLLKQLEDKREEVQKLEDEKKILEETVAQLQQNMDNLGAGLNTGTFCASCLQKCYLLCCRQELQYWFLHLLFSDSSLPIECYLKEDEDKSLSDETKVKGESSIIFCFVSR